MSETIQNSKQYDLEERTFLFARDVVLFSEQAQKTIANIINIKQVVRSSGSVAANYIEANEALSKKDFLMRIKICRKEAKESILWLRIIRTGNNVAIQKEQQRLIIEATELMKIFGAILRNSK